MRERKMWIRMLRSRDFPLPEDRRISHDYQAGREYSVRRHWGEALIARGDAVEIKPPRRPLAKLLERASK